jgi:hypothetical protein
MSKILIQHKFHHDQNHDVENFNSKHDNRSIPESKQPILMSKNLMQPTFDQYQNLDVKFFYATKN